MWLKKLQKHLKKTFAHASPTAMFFIIAGLVLFFFITKIQDETTPRAVLPALTFVPKPKTERAASDGANRVDALCASLPQPEKFEFVSKTAPAENEQFVSIAYTFRSSRAASELYPTFILWLNQNGWTDNKPAYARLEFSKDNQTIWLAPHSTNDGDFFTLNCSEWKIEPSMP